MTSPSQAVSTDIPPMMKSVRKSPLTVVTFPRCTGKVTPAVRDTTAFAEL